MRTTHHYDDKEPTDLKEPWPNYLFPDFKAQLEELQKDYNEMLKQARRQSAPGSAQTVAEPINRGFTAH